MNSSLFQSAFTQIFGNCFVELRPSVDLWISTATGNKIGTCCIVMEAVKKKQTCDYIYLYAYTYIHTLHYVTLHYITLHNITLHNITLHTYLPTYIYIYIYMYVYIYLHKHTDIYIYIYGSVLKQVHQKPRCLSSLSPLDESSFKVPPTSRSIPLYPSMVGVILHLLLNNLDV